MRDSAIPAADTASPVAGGEPIPVELTTDAQGWQTAERDGLPEGDYRVTVSGNGVHPVTEVISVVDVKTIV